MNSKNYILIILTACLSFQAMSNKTLWTAKKTAQNTIIKVEKPLFFELDMESMRNLLDEAPMENLQNGFTSKFTISLPMPDGTFEEFYIQQTRLMEEGLADQFPGIKTFSGYSTKSNLHRITLDYTYKGFHAMITYPGDVVYIDPINLDTQSEYISYYKSDFYASNHPDMEEIDVIYDQDKSVQLPSPTKPQAITIGGQLNTYRLAVATTGEYSQFHGGTQAGVLSAVQTSIARVNSVYEVDLGVRLILVDSTFNLFYYDANNDPYDNYNGGAMLGQNQSTVDAVIGNANYDIGHVFSTGGGGIANYASVCDFGDKAKGVTGSGAPIGDPFDIDYVAHEIGHQFSGSHTFDGIAGSCGNFNRSAFTAYEPGSGSTIMAYAGICSSDNIQSNSDPYFHIGSFIEMTNFIYNGGGASCATVITTSNNAPVVNANPTNSNYIIPIETAFELIGEASDPDSHALTYVWEEYDKTFTGSPVNSPSGSSPLFRSWQHDIDGYHRVFPRIQDIVNNTTVVGETYPFSSRVMEFKLTARDNIPGGGGVDYDEIFLDVVDAAGPFLVTQPNTNVNWIANTYQIIKWDPANTNSGAVNTPSVDIFLSTDGGYTYPDTLLTGTPNDGIQMVLMPNINTSTARVKIKGHDNIFFDISNQNFSIAPSAQNSFTVNYLQDTIKNCAPDDINFTLYYSSLGSFSDQVNITINNVPSGASHSLTKTSLTPNDSSVVTITNTGNITTGAYNVYIQSSSNGVNVIDTIVLVVNNGLPDAPTAVSPSTEFVGFLSPTFTWNSVDVANYYQLQIASDPNFTSVIKTVNNITDTTYVYREVLDEKRDYYWRVKSIAECQGGNFGPGTQFTTKAQTCDTIEIENLPTFLLMYDENPFTFDIATDTTRIISDVNVLDLQITHPTISDLYISLTSPSLTEVVLINRICTLENNINVGFDDQSYNTSLPCPPVDGADYRPTDALNKFTNEVAGGSWLFMIDDQKNGSAGELEAAVFEVCTMEKPIISSVKEFIADVNIYPNPSNSIIYIQSNVKVEKVEMVNMLGELVKNEINVTNHINISDLSEGIYFTKVHLQNGEIITKRVTKQ